MHSNQDQDRNSGKSDEPGFDLLCELTEHDALPPDMISPKISIASLPSIQMERVRDIA